jgi:hypothetical protein
MNMIKAYYMYYGNIIYNLPHSISTFKAVQLQHWKQQNIIDQAISEFCDFLGNYGSILGVPETAGIPWGGQVDELLEA